MHFRFRFLFFILFFWSVKSTSHWNKNTQGKSPYDLCLLLSLSLCIPKGRPCSRLFAHLLVTSSLRLDAEPQLILMLSMRLTGKQNKKKLQTAVLHPPARASRDHWGAAASHSSSLCLLASLSVSAPPPQMHLGIQCRLIPLTSEDPSADTLRVRAVKIIIIKNWEKPSKKGK